MRSDLAILKPYESTYSPVYCWFAQIQPIAPPIIRFPFCLTLDDRRIRIKKRYTTQAYFAKITNAQPEILTECQTEEQALDTIYKLSKELAFVGYPMFDLQGELLTPPDEITHYPAILPLFADLTLHQPPTQALLSFILNQITLDMRAAEYNRRYVAKHKASKTQSVINTNQASIRRYNPTTNTIDPPHPQHQLPPPEKLVDVISEIDKLIEQNTPPTP